MRAPLVAAACWWIPLFLILLALTIEGSAASPARLRLIVIAVAAVMLSFGFFLGYVRRPKSDSRLRGLWRFNVAMTWIVAAGAIAFGVTSFENGATRPEVAATATAVGNVDPAKLAGATKKTYIVKGMTCQGCVQTVTEALTGVPGVFAAEVDLVGGSAVVSMDPARIPPDSAVVGAVVEAGYKAWPLDNKNHKADNEGSI
jgi:copper chaperone CopZ